MDEISLLNVKTLIPINQSSLELQSNLLSGLYNSSISLFKSRILRICQFLDFKQHDSPKMKWVNSYLIGHK